MFTRHPGERIGTTQKIPKIGKIATYRFSAIALKNYVISMTYKQKSAWSDTNNCSYSVSALADKHYAVNNCFLHFAFQ